MSIDDFDKYDDELTEREYKNTSETDINKKRYKGITIETLNSWPDGLIVATLCSMSADGNLFAGVNLQDDEEVIQIDKWMNSSELYFFKLLMKADTEIASARSSWCLTPVRLRCSSSGTQHFCRSGRSFLQGRR